MKKFKNPTDKRDAYKTASYFISSLPVKPVKWELSGSWKEGTGRPGQSDIDIAAWFVGADETILMAIYAEAKPVIDFHWYCREWGVYQVDPELWDRQLAGIKKENKKMKTSKIKKEFAREDRETGMEKLIHLSYDRLADGGRNRNRSPRRIDPETADAIRRAFC